MVEEFTYDVFIGYSAVDRDAVVPVAERLRADGLDVWLDVWQDEAGSNWSERIQQGLEMSRALLIFMSEEFFATEWQILEPLTLPFRNSTNAKRRLVPILLEDCALPDSIAQFLYVDWRKRDFKSYALILASCGFDESQSSQERRRSNAGELGVSSAVLGHHKGFIEAIAFTPDGRRVISGSSDHNLKIWDVRKRRLIATLRGHTRTIRGISIGPDGSRLYSCADDGTVRIWDLAGRSLVATLETELGQLNSIAVTPDASKAIIAGDGGTFEIWDLNHLKLVASQNGHNGAIYDLSISPDGQTVLSASYQNSIKIWDIATQGQIAELKGHSSSVGRIRFTSGGKRAVSSSCDNTLRLWDLKSRSLIATLEGHTDNVWALDVTPNGSYAVSGSNDGELCFWDLENQSLGAAIETGDTPILSLAITPDGRRAVSGSQEGKIVLWELPPGARVPRSAGVTRYTNAKVCLVGEQTVGKTGLALRLAEDRWQETGSTHGMTVAKLDLPPGEDSEVDREVWLWDFAGQPDYRLVHQLYMDETALALMVIDPQKDQPFAPLAYWEQALSRAVGHDPSKLLVAARCDRGGYMISDRQVGDYAARRGYADSVKTAAKLQGDPGCTELRRLIAEHIPWERLPSTSTTHLFRILKDAVIRIRDSGVVLIRVAELEQRLRFGLSEESFTEAELRTVIGLLAGQGIIQKLGFGDFVLLQPEQINNYGSAVVRAARSCPSELAELSEQDILNGDIDFQDLKRLNEHDEKLLLRAMLQTFLDRGLCYRIKPEGGDRLVFPAYFKHDRPELPEQPDVLITYRFTGPVDQIYTTLIVRLHYTNDFEIDRLWRYAADFKSLGGGQAGLILTKERDDVATIKVFFDANCSMDSKVSFIKYVHEHLKKDSTDVTRHRDYVCPHCGTAVENRDSVAKKLKEGKKDIICVECEKRVPLIDLIEQKFASDAFLRNVQEMDREAQFRLDNESLELILIGHAFSTVGEAGHIFRPIPNSDWGIDGEIEFKNAKGEASGRRLYLQLKSGDSYLRRRKRDGAEVFEIKNPRHAEYWQAHEYPVMLVIRGSDERIRWMNVTDYLKREGKDTKRIVFDGETFNAVSIYNKWRELEGSAARS